MDWIEMDLIYVKLLESLRARTRTVSRLYITIRLREQYENESAGIYDSICVLSAHTRSAPFHLIVCYCTVFNFIGFVVFTLSVQYVLYSTSANQRIAPHNKRRE